TVRPRAVAQRRDDLPLCPFSDPGLAVGRDVGADDMPDHTVIEREAAGQFHRRDRVSLRIARRMTTAASGERVDQIRPALMPRVARAGAIEGTQRYDDADRC